MISIKTEKELQIMAEGGKILAGILKELGKNVRPGITTMELETLAEGLILKAGGKCSFKGYDVPDDASLTRPYPSCLCTSLNHEIVHAIPSKKVLKNGDIISLDLGIFYKGFHTDMASTFAVGDIPPQTKKLLEVTKKALEIGIEKVKPGNRIGDISRAIQKYVEGQGFNVVRELCGHGIGREVHEDPQILNSVSFSKESVDKIEYLGDGKIKIKEGMVLCLEPMVTVGNWRIKRSNDGFAFETKDGSLSAHFEHTVAVTKEGNKVLTI